ncbi:MAG: hypothetical protein SFV32_09265 [Opitutaceae bacterium]|nr:hypothetical protein [Opitutaceae bacterium]
MNSSAEPALRFRGGERHHLFNNNGTWFVRYCVRYASWLKADRRIARSLGTRDLRTAIARRDAILANLKEAR